MRKTTENKMQEYERVRLLHDPSRIGILTGRDKKRRNRVLLQVQFTDGIRWVPASQLEKVGDVRLSPLDMLENKKLGRPVDLRRTLTHVKLAGRLADVIYSMEATNTDFYAYQFKPVVKILESPSNGLLIADEVGLGKTIEAGLIWTELRSRFDMRRLLVLCPAALRDKWRLELSGKIGVSSQICDAPEALSILQDEDSQARGFAIVASLQGLRPPRRWEEDNLQYPAAKLASFLRAVENEERTVDLLVIDEAHHLRNPETQTYELGNLCKNVSEYTVLLTATPIHNRNRDLFSLLRLLDPDTFVRMEDFTQILEANAPLVRARDLLLGSDPDFKQFRKLINLSRRHPLLKSNRQLSMIEENAIAPEYFERRDVRSELAYRLEKVNLLAHVVTRTRKRDVKEWRVIREPFPEFVSLEPVERKFYDLVSEVVITYAQKSMANERFLLAQPQRQMTSSMAASLRLWQKKLVELEESKESSEFGDGVGNQKKSLGPLVTEIVRRSRNYVDLNHLIEVDTKYRRLKMILTNYLRDNPNEKVIVFSAFHATLDYLAERLKENGISCILLKGGQKEPKSQVIDRFSRPGGPEVLLSSEVGGEGVDLQFSRVVINYDLPWNPMRLEQRIGRVDRLGQAADKVIIWNILYEDTIDARIYQRLYEKLNLCCEALGDFEAILGDEIRKLEIDLLSGKLTVEEQEKLIDQTAQALENLRLEEKQLEHDAANLIAYGDYILNQVQAARELHRWVGGHDIKRYIFDYLRLHYPGCEMRQIEPGSLLYEIELSDRAKFDLDEFIKKNRLSFYTRLTSVSRPIRCRFENRVAGPVSRFEEVISQFHPLVRMVSSRITEKDEQLTPAVALILDSKETDFPLQTGVYVLAVAHWSFKGLQDTEKLAYTASPLENSEKALLAEDAEKLAAAAVSGGKDWFEACNVVDLEHVYYVANEILFGRLDDEYEVFYQDLMARNEDRADLQLRTLEQHYKRQMVSLGDTREKHRIHNREALVKATEGRMRALKNRVQQQRLRIENRRAVQSDTREIAIAIIKVI